MSQSRLPIHPYAAIFPPMTGPEFDGLCRSIARGGLDEKIVLYEGMILDGCRRDQACRVTGVTPRYREYDGECGSPLNFVVAKNLHRRHLTEGQRAIVAVKLKPLFEEEARQRQRAALKQGLPVGPNPKENELSTPQGNATPAGLNSGQAEEQALELPVGLNLDQREKPKENELSTPQGSEIAAGLNSGQPETSRSAQRVAELMKVSRCSVHAADKVTKQGVPQLVDAVMAGKVSVSAAAGIAKLPAEQQQAVLAGMERGLKPKEAVAQVKVTCDDDGRPLTEAVLPAFRQRDELQALCRRIESLGRAVEQLGGSPVSVYLDVPRMVKSLEAVRQELWAAQPARLCPHGPGDESGCDVCRGHGWLPVTVRKNNAA
jgi:hypothetical protein